MLGLSACAAPPVENNYYPVEHRVYVPVHTDTTPRKSSPSVSSSDPEEFRAVERPSSYSN